MRIEKDKNTGDYKVWFRSESGKMRSLSTKTANREIAEKIVKDSGIESLEMAATAGRLTAEAISLITAGKKITIEEAIEEWVRWLQVTGLKPNSVFMYRVLGRHLAKRTTGLNSSPSSITADHINGWLNNPNENRKALTKQSRLRSIRSLFNFLNAKGWCVGNPSKLVKINYSILSHAQKERKTCEIFTDDDYKRVLNMAVVIDNPFWKSAIPIARWTGLRLVDIACLEWDSFNKEGYMTVWTRKKDRRVELELKPETLAAAVSMIPRCDKIHCFPKEREMATDPGRRKHLSTQFQSICKDCGVKGKRFHGLRHTYITAQDAAGIPIEHIARAVGHGTWLSTRDYIHRMRDKEKEALLGETPPCAVDPAQQKNSVVPSRSIPILFVP